MAPTRIAMGLAVLLIHAPLLAARCGDVAGDLASVAAARDAIAAACDCGGATSPKDYATCARGVIAQRMADGLLPSVCARGVRSCTRRSTCGRPGTVACCRGGTKPRCKITTPERCAASGRCVATQASCCDACNIFGCVTTTTSPPTTNPSLCGNGVLDPGERCDGEPFCLQGCVLLPGSQCCERSDASGVCSGLLGSTGFSARYTCQVLGGTRFQWGGTPPAGGGPCQSGAPAPFSIEGACGPPATFPPTSFCCIGSTCNQLVASDVAELSEWLATQCNFNGTYPATVGHCTEVSPGSRVCTPGT